MFNATCTDNIITGDRNIYLISTCRASPLTLLRRHIFSRTPSRRMRMRRVLPACFFQHAFFLVFILWFKRQLWPRGRPILMIKISHINHLPYIFHHNFGWALTSTFQARMRGGRLMFLLVCISRFTVLLVKLNMYLWFLDRFRSKKRPLSSPWCDFLNV